MTGSSSNFQNKMILLIIICLSLDFVTGHVKQKVVYCFQQKIYLDN